LRSTEAVYLASKSGYDRLLETSKTPGTISPNDLDQAVARMNSDLAQLESAKAAVKEVRNTLAYLTIRAPFSGVISARNVNPGAYVGSGGAGAPLFVLQEQRRLRLVVSIPEAYSAYLKNGDEVSFHIKSLPQKDFTARVMRMAGALDLKLRSQRVEMDVSNKAANLLPGMIANVTIPLKGGDSTFIVPKSAIVNSQENVFVIRVENDTARWVNVETGRRTEEKSEIYGPLQEGDVLVRNASDEIRNGQVLRTASGKY
jgi:RND family efflux transporter MFP subunit